MLRKNLIEHLCDIFGLNRKIVLNSRKTVWEDVGLDEVRLHNVHWSGESPWLRGQNGLKKSSTDLWNRGTNFLTTMKLSMKVFDRVGTMVFKKFRRLIK